MMYITIGESYEIQSTFYWSGSIDFVGAESAYSIKGLRFFSRDSHDIKIANMLKEKFPELFENFEFYTEEGVNKVLFSTTSTARLKIH